jgi:hypothetical protein
MVSRDRRDFGPDLLNNTRSLMTKHHWAFDALPVDGTVLIPVHVATADADSGDSDSEILGTHLARQVDVSEREMEFALENERPCRRSLHAYLKIRVRPDSA